MSNIIKVKCNGPKQHINDVDIEELAKRVIIMKRAMDQPSPRRPERHVLPCKSCTQGKVIVTREMMEENL